MEPLRGGILANGLPEKAKKEFYAVDKDRTPAEWALRWLWNRPEPTVVLSGMSAKEQINQNVKTACGSVAGGMSGEELDAVKKVVGIMQANIKVDCTGCGYCMPCPAGVDIPEAFSRYNEGAVFKRIHTIKNYMMSAGILADRPGFASLCAKCGKCEMHCPQDVKIIEKLSGAKKYLEPFWVRPAVKIARRFIVGGRKKQ